MCNTRCITVSRIVMLFGLLTVAGGNGISTASAQVYYNQPYVPAAPPVMNYHKSYASPAPPVMNYNQPYVPPAPPVMNYSQVMPAAYSPQTPGNYATPRPSAGTIRQVFWVASQPTSTHVEGPRFQSPPNVFPISAPAPPPVSAPAPVPSVAPTPEPLNATPYVAPLPEETITPAYHNGYICHECTEESSGRPCDWFCRLQKRMRGAYRASQRSSECSFEYPVVTPTGTPYGYVQPTWSDFSAGPNPQGSTSAYYND